jgi:hypothetical protein
MVFNEAQPMVILADHGPMCKPIQRGPGSCRIAKAQPFPCCRAAAKENAQQGCGLLQNLSRCLVDASGGRVPLSAEPRMSNQAGYPQKVSDDSSRRRVFFESRAAAGRPNICTGARFHIFPQIVRCQKFGKLRLRNFVA